MAKDETGLLSSAKQPSSEAGTWQFSLARRRTINEDKDTHVLSSIHRAARNFPATFGAICAATVMGILGLVLMVTGASLAQASTVANQTTSHTAAVTEHPAEPMSPAQLLRLSHLHALHVAHLLHLAHLARLAELARQAEYAQKLAAEKTTLAADAQVPATNSVRYQGTTSMQQCIINAESGGNPYIWNASGHWGLYQFSYGTWVAHGGVAADFGHAGPAEQTAVFWQTVHDDGYTDWTPYDGC